MTRLGFRSIFFGIVVVLLVAGFVMLAVIDVSPPQRSIEIQIPNDRFTR